MHGTHLAGVDLNLLPLLDALLTERHLTRAARRVGLSQPAASRALGRLRVVLADPLLVRAGPTWRLTARAEALRDPVRMALGLLEGALTPAAPFNPATAQRTIRVASDDYAELVVLAPLLSRLSRVAPGLAVQVLPARGTSLDGLVRGDVDVSFAPAMDRLPASVNVERLAPDRFVCMVAASHPFARRTPTLARFLEARHALIAPRGQRGGYVDDALAALGKRRHVTLALPHFLVMPFFVASTDLVLTLAERVARIYSRLLRVTLFNPPLRLPGFTTALYWHHRDSHDPALTWFREQVVALRASLAHS
jgi:DNA-binding transcriptional LysR family regulator